MPVERTLAERLQRVEDELAIHRLLGDYGRALDYGQEDRFVGCFTEDAVWIARRRSGHERTLRGHDQLRSFARQHTRAPEVYHKHLVGNIDVVVGEATATATSYFVRLDVDETPGAAPLVFATGRYLDELTRCEDGRWRITRRLAEVEDRFRD